jgi:hypothetical protein
MSSSSSSGRATILVDKVSAYLNFAIIRIVLNLVTEVDSGRNGSIQSSWSCAWMQRST